MPRFCWKKNSVGVKNQVKGVRMSGLGNRATTHETARGQRDQNKR